MPSTEIRPALDVTLLARIEQFLYDEADLLDRRKFPEWLELFTEDCTYWIPSGFDEIDTSRKVSLVFDNHQTLSERVWRFEGGLAYAQQPQSRTARAISNIQIVSVDTSGDSPVIEVQARFMTAEFRRGAQTIHAGRVVHTLVDVGDSFQIRNKKVELINNDGFLGNLSLPL